MTSEMTNLRFASDATYFVIGGSALLAIAVIARWAEIRRTKRQSIDAVGWVPWTKLFFICAVVGLITLSMGIHGWFVPG